LINVAKLEICLGPGLTAVEDTDKALDMFFQFCNAAGPETCAYHDSSPSKIKSNFNQLVESLIARPVPFVSKSSDPATAALTQIYGVIDWGFLRKATFNVLYQPWRTWPIYAFALAQLQTYINERNDTSPSFSLDPAIAPLLGVQAAVTCADICGCTGESNGTVTGKSYPETKDQFIAVACNDFPRSPPEFDTFRKEWAAFEKASKLGGAWFQNKAWCTYVFLLPLDPSRKPHKYL
jgi:hypothetical protein